MKTRVIKFSIFFIAIVCLGTECQKEGPDGDTEVEITIIMTITPSTGPINSLITFSAEGSKYEYDGDFSTNLTYKWDFNYLEYGDIIWDTELSSNPIQTYIYDSPGTYQVILKAAGGGASATETRSIVITEVTNNPPVAEFEGDPTSGTAPLDVNFTDLSTNDPTSWQWDFGNGESSTEPNPSYTYEFEGIYLVKLTVSNSDGNDIEEKIDYITVTSGVVDIPCPGEPTVSDIDGNIYNTVLIGDQCWMKENLKTTTYQDGTPIPNVIDSYEWFYLLSGAYCWYENEDAWKDKYGALYNYYAVDDPKGLCPAGWHVPTHDELTEFTDYIGGLENPHGNELKSCWQVNSPLGGDCNTTEHPRWKESSWHGTDNYGFSALPGGRRHYYGAQFESLGDAGYWWTSTSDPSTGAYFLNLWAISPGISVLDLSLANGHSIRCIKDD